jgi:microcystin-dependent protein/cytoskeletal protein CcmA (bactofilin family)
MATTIQNLHSLSAGSLPGDLLPGQVAYNLADGFVYLGSGGNSYLDTLGNVIGTATVPGQGWQQAIFNSGPVNGSAIFGGLYDAVINEVTSVTAAGTVAGLTVGDPLPASGAGNTDVYVLVQVGGTLTPPAPAGTAEVGDWIISTGNGWSLINQSSVTIPAQNVTVVPTGDIASTNVQSALLELDLQTYNQAGGAIGGKVIIDTGLPDIDALVIQNGGGAQIEGPLSADGAANFGSTMTVTGPIITGGSVSCSGVTSAGNVVVTGAVTATGAVSGASGTFGTLAVSSTSNFTGAISANILSVAQSLNVGTAAGGDNMVVQATSSFTAPASFSDVANFSADNNFSGVKTTTFAASTTLNVQGKFNLSSGANATVNGAVLANQLIPVGGIIIWPATAVPTTPGFVRCDGAALNRTTYAALFAIIGTTYGAGNGTTTFNVPDYRGVFLRGDGQNSSINNAAGVKAGTAGRLTGSSQVDSFASHNHNMVDANGANINTNWRNLTDSINAGGGSGLTSGGNVNFGLPRVSNTGGGETNPVNVAVTYLIRAL